MSFKSRDLTVKLSEGEGGNCDGCTNTQPGCGGCTNTQPGCGGCTNTQPNCGACSPSPDRPIYCTKTKPAEEDQQGQSVAGLGLLRQQLQETLGAELR